MLKKAGHIILIPLLVVATMGMTINMHYCKGKLYDLGIFTQAANCYGEHVNMSASAEVPKQTKSNHLHNCCSSHHSKSDCKDESIKLNHVDNYIVSAFNFDSDHSSINIFPITTELTRVSGFSDASKFEFQKSDSSPPDTHIKLPFLQTYLI